MVLPIIIGVGVTFAAVTARSGIRAWEVYQKLTPLMIARLNRIRLTEAEINFQRESSVRFRNLSPTLKARLDQYRGGFSARMTEAEALLILGISGSEVASLNEQLLKRKHHKAMVQNHPDRGGSPFLAMKINEARDVLCHSVMLKK
ncbi:Mdj2p [Lachancea thermotolerans CBS 6340]|uniref:KLTH0F19624p n=1 Tax=Lachancea thermotolerans (strain ATCC 56472 / CBS 6340 / NRRL Y-8284) TaxID=559295 RepID=C5DJW4_LACTC|nr:KLTH0F19624p [Lachancea thermotolerans CBS 6340]CAR24603.1 KLTH0F19624p [Lachancea thermotolerans CBS 6340]